MVEAQDLVTKKVVAIKIVQKKQQYTEQAQTEISILHQLLLAVLQFRAFAVQFALRLCQGALVLPQALRRRHGAAKEGFLRIVIAEGSATDE